MPDDGPIEVWVVARDATQARKRAQTAALGLDVDGYVHGARLRAERHSTALNLRILENAGAYETYENARLYVWSVIFDAELAGI